MEITLGKLAQEAYPQGRFRYLENLNTYERYLRAWRGRKFNLLEINPKASYIDFALWADYFPSSNIFCACDMGALAHKGKSRDLNMENLNFFSLTELDRLTEGRTFDVIIDSSGQAREKVEARFSKLFLKLNANGFFFIERLNEEDALHFSFNVNEKPVEMQDFSGMDNYSRGPVADYRIVVFEKKNNIERALSNVLGK